VDGTCSTHVKTRTEYKIFVDKPEGKREFWRPKRIWEDNGLHSSVSGQDPARESYGTVDKRQRI